LAEHPKRPIVSRRYEQRRQTLLARHVRGPDVLDVGYAEMPNPHLRPFHTVGLDLHTPAEPSGYAEEIVGDALDLDSSVGGRRFDTIVCGQLLEHLEAPYRFLRTVRRFLKADGRLVLSIPNPLGFPIVFAELFRMKRFFYAAEHRFLLPPRWVERMLQETGYLIEAVRPVGLWLLVLVLPCPVALSYQVVYVARPKEPCASD